MAVDKYDPSALQSSLEILLRYHQIRSEERPTDGRPDIMCREVLGDQVCKHPISQRDNRTMVFELQRRRLCLTADGPRFDETGSDFRRTVQERTHEPHCARFDEQTITTYGDALCAGVITNVVLHDWLQSIGDKYWRTCYRVYGTSALQKSNAMDCLLCRSGSILMRSFWARWSKLN
jgi:hypothetical protein